MPDRGPNNEEPARGLDTDESIIDCIRRPATPLVGWDWARRTHDVTVLNEDGAIRE
jgi:hypothetical protein